MRLHKVAIATTAIVATSAGCLAGPHKTIKATHPEMIAASLPVYKNPSATLDARVDDLFAALTQDEKLTLLSGTGFTIQPIPRLGIPGVGMADAGQGVRGGTQGTEGPATLFPTEVDMARSWNTDLLSQIGHAIGEEVQNKGEGAQILLGPDVNIHRSPLGGRNAESFTEDPYLNAQLAVGYIDGMQSSGALACIKHYACNNEEQDRMTVDVRVDERALREIYLPAFKAGITQAHSHTIMAAYNKINGPYATANHYLLTDVLKNQWGFDGIVMSDWGAVHDTAGPVAAGCDLEMPGGQFMTAPKLQEALSNGQITQAEIDGAVKRILRTIIRTGLLDGPKTPDHSVVNSPAHQKLAYQAATQGIVLLKNQKVGSHSLLPIDTARVKSIAVIGPAAAKMQAGALGSPNVQPFYTIEPLDGIKTAAGSGVRVDYVEGVSLPNPNPDPIPTDNLTAPDGSHGLKAEFYTTPDLSGSPAAERVDTQTTFFRGYRPPQTPTPIRSARWTGKLTVPKSGTYTLALLTDAGCKLTIDGKSVIDEPAQGGNWYHAGKIDLEAGRSYDLVAEFRDIKERVRGRIGWILPEIDDIDSAAKAAAKADLAVVFVSTGGQEGEGNDRPSMALPGDQDKLIDAVAKANPNTIVVLNAGSPVLMPWLDRVPTLVDMGFPGEEGGHALADILFGNVDPSGKLTDTIAARREDYPDFGNFPGTNGTVHYTEGIYVGYRYFDKKAIKPIYPFGYGLSYTTFKYANLKLSAATLNASGQVTASVDVTNTGKRAGAEVVELYISPKGKLTVDRPIQELKGFSKVTLTPGETRPVTLTIKPQDLAYYNVDASLWQADPGEYTINVGASSRDIRQSATLTLTGKWTGQP
jgi:beta-glucosidase